MRSEQGHHEKEKTQRRVILCNDGGTLVAPNREAPIGVDGFVKATIDPLRDTSINTLYWQLGTDPFLGTDTFRLSDWYSHDTKVGPIWGQGRQKFKTAGEWRIYENARSVRESGLDVPAAAIKHGHEAGLDVFLALRINDGHDFRLERGLEDENMSPTRRNNPDWLLGSGAHVHDSVPEGFGLLKDHLRFVLNFGVDEVRDYVRNLVFEAIDNYDLDGFDLDFIRQPTLFKAGETERGAALLTQLLMDIRKRLDEKSRKVGRQLYLSVRVPLSLAENIKAGLDIPGWITSGIVNIVVVGDPGGWNYRLPVEDFLALRGASDCQIVTQNMCTFHEDRGRSAAVLFGERSNYSSDQYRAVAATHWLAGAQGQYIWNQHFLQFVASDKVDLSHWKDIGSPERLARANKHYVVGPVGRGGNLPIKLAEPNDTASVTFEIADNFAATGGPDVATLRIRIEQLTAKDGLSIVLNGKTLDRDGAVSRYNYNDCWLDFEARDVLKRGSNSLVIRVQGRNAHVAAPLVLKNVDVIVKYDR